MSKVGGRELRGDASTARLDEAARRRRARKALEALEADNFGDDPHAALSVHRQRPKFHDQHPSQGPQVRREAGSCGGTRRRRAWTRRPGGGGRARPSRPWRRTTLATTHTPPSPSTDRGPSSTTSTPARGLRSGGRPGAAGGRVDGAPGRGGPAAAGAQGPRGPGGGQLWRRPTRRPLRPPTEAQVPRPAPQPGASGQAGGRELRGDASTARLDEAARRRRARKALEALEADNFGDDPHAALSVHRQRPKFHDQHPSQGPQESASARKKAKLRGQRQKQRFAKRLADLVVEEDLRRPHAPNYASAQVPASRLPARKFCAVCGGFSNYTCLQCGALYCSHRCLATHKDTRCLKWTA